MGLLFNAMLSLGFGFTSGVLSAAGFALGAWSGDSLQKMQNAQPQRRQLGEAIVGATPQGLGLVVLLLIVGASIGLISACVTGLCHALLGWNFALPLSGLGAVCSFVFGRNMGE
jgi:hypothetical protein